LGQARWNGSVGMAPSDNHRHELKEIHEDVPPDFYDASIKTNRIQRYWHGRRFTEVARLASQVDGLMLDVGCNGGTLTAKISARVKPDRVVGLDISDKAIAYTMQRHPDFDLLVGHAEDLPFRDETFDAIFCSEVLEHVERPARLLTEVKRCLRSNSYAVVVVPAETPLFKFLWFFWTRLGPGRVWHHAHVQDFRGDSLAKLAEEAGFRVTKDKRFMLGMLRAVKVTPI
jgi:ubiquinone/menaquinone biosynthesis C-methylase UbiE